MSSEWKTYTVEELISTGVLAPPLDGNHGEIHPKSSDFVASGIPFIMASDMKNGRLDTSTCAFITAKQAASLRKGFSKSGDVLLSHKATIGRTAIVGEIGWDYLVLTPQVTYYRVLDSKKLNNRYLKYYFDSEPFQQTLAAWSGAGSTRAYLGITAQRKLPIVFPPIKIQQAIAETIGALDDRIALLRETNSTLEAIAQALFKSWFVDFDPVHAKQQGIAPEGLDEATAALFPDGFEESELGLVPRGWSIGSIGKIAEVVDCLHAKKPELLSSGKPYLQLNTIRDDGLLDTSNISFISDADYHKWVSRIEVSKGDCVITNVGRVGAVAQIPESFCAAIGRNMTAIRMRKEWLYPTYLVELLQSPFMEGEIQRRTDIGTILDALNVRNIPLLRCVLAGQGILSAFENAARPLRAAMEANLERANTLATLRDTLLPRLISGQLRIPEVEGVAP